MSMKERPIPFSGPMVRALLDDTKTQTRRLCKLDMRAGMPEPELASLLKCCPYGQPGDRLWVREAWRAPGSCDHLPPRSISDCEAVRFMADEVVGADPGFGKGRPGMFMPRWASRITLEITAVRVERLQDISEADAIAEGLFQDTAGRWTTYSATEAAKEHLSPVQAYRDLWEQINGTGSWDANPWVWVLEFKRLKGGAA